MATFELILLLAVAVLLSSIVDQVVPKVSSPLIQIGLGVVIALLAIAPVEIAIEPDLFLVLFIAPLLFSDSLEANKKNLWDNKASIISLAIGLVLLITLCVGFAVHWLVPSIPLAAAFALGAALGPTDAVAVQSLSKEAQLARREGAVLQGECLLNDASGVVSFQFAIAAALTGAFSLATATVSLCFSFIGGIGFGIVLAFLFLFVSTRVRNLGLDNITFHVLFEVSMPFVVFLASELLGVSGILAVVACGIVWSMYNKRKISPYRSRLNIALTSVWKVLGFTLNGIVFVLLGMQLPLAMQSTWDDVYINNFALIGYVLGITFLIVALRYVWALIMLRITKNPSTGKRDRLNKETAKNALIMTVGGPKGAITLSIILSIPFLLSDGSSFPQRSLIIFLASGVILCTLLLANFMLPLLAPKGKSDDEESKEELLVTKIAILRTVIERLMVEATEENDRDTKIVVGSYNTRIATIRDMVDIEPPSSIKIRIETINYQANHLIEAVDRKEIDSYTCFTYLRRLMYQKNLLAHDKAPLLSFQMYWSHINTIINITKNNIIAFFTDKQFESDENMRAVRILSERFALDYLRSRVDDPDYPSEIIAKLIIAHERVLSMLDPNEATTEQAVERATAQIDAIQRKGLQIELEVIQDYYSSGQLTRAQAKGMRDNVSLMLVDLEERV